MTSCPTLHKASKDNCRVPFILKINSCVGLNKCVGLKKFSYFISKSWQKSLILPLKILDFKL